jgi:lysophospholipase L1-like esterase
VIGEKKDGANAQDKELDEYALLIRQLATDNQLLLVDLRRLFGDDIALKNDTNQASGVLTTDGVHLNEMGNQLVAEAFVNALYSLQQP